MKKLNTNNAGRMPLWQADLDWLQDAFTEPIMALVRELNGQRDFMPITGCKVTKTGKRIFMTSGWFWWNDEILPVRELQPTIIASFTNPVVHLEKVTYNDPDGARNFIHADFTSESVSDVWQDDYILPTVVERGGTFTSGVHILPGARTLFDEIKMRITDSESEWRNTSLQGLQYKRIGRMVVLNGFPTVDNSGIIPSLPVASGLPKPLGGTAYLIAKTGVGHIESYISDEYLYCYGTETVSPCLTGMMYMAAEPYESLPTDMNVVVCEQYQTP